MKTFLPIVALALAGNVFAAVADRADEPIADARTALADTVSADHRAADDRATAPMSRVAPERRGGRVVGSRNYSLHFDEAPSQALASQARR